MSGATSLQHPILTLTTQYSLLKQRYYFNSLRVLTLNIMQFIDMKFSEYMPLSFHYQADYPNRGYYSLRNTLDEGRREYKERVGRILEELKRDSAVLSIEYICMLELDRILKHIENVLCKYVTAFVLEQVRNIRLFYNGSLSEDGSDSGHSSENTRIPTLQPLSDENTAHTGQLNSNLIRSKKRERNHRVIERNKVSNIHRRYHRFPNGVRRVLIGWCEEHLNDPYPSKSDLEMLSLHTNLTHRQISAWITHHRRRSIIRRFGLQ